MYVHSQDVRLVCRVVGSTTGRQNRRKRENGEDRALSWSSSQGTDFVDCTSWLPYRRHQSSPSPHPRGSSPSFSLTSRVRLGSGSAIERRCRSHSSGTTPSWPLPSAPTGAITSRRSGMPSRPHSQTLWPPSRLASTHSVPSMPNHG